MDLCHSQSSFEGSAVFGPHIKSLQAMGSVVVMQGTTEETVVNIFFK